MSKPNIIYILADDLGYGDVSCLNANAAFKTKHLDSLYENGLAFTDAHATSAVCTPSRYSILTGRYNWRSRLKKSVLGGFSSALIEPGRMTAASYLQNQGYKTAAIGKWHLGMDFAKKPHFQEKPDFSESEAIAYDLPIKNAPTDFGFDTFFGISASLDMPPYVYIENDRFTAVPKPPAKEGRGKQFYRQGLTAEGFDHHQVLATLNQKVISQIEAWKEEPFFIYYPMTAPHTPILPPDEYLGRSGTNEYGDFVLYMDDLVGDILQKLKDEDLFDNTLVIFTSDNGCSPMADFDELKRCGHHPSYVFRGHKADIYEGGHRIPLLIQWPAKIKGRQTSDDLVSLVDFFATLADLLGTKPPDIYAEDSVSNLPIWLDQQNQYQPRSLVQQSIDGSLSLRKGPYKLVMCPGSGGWSWPESGKIIPGMPAFQFFDLRQDISEQNNLALAHEHDEVIQEMKNELADIVKNGRSTPGSALENNGEPVWDTVSWLESSTTSPQ